MIHHTQCGIATLHRRGDARPSRQQLADRHNGRFRLAGLRRGTWFNRGELYRLADDLRQHKKSGRGRDAHPQSSPVPGDIPIYGYIYDVKTGRLEEVPEATEAGKVP